MADIALTTTRIAPVFPHFAEIYSFITGVTVTPGAAVYLNTSTGKLALANATTAPLGRMIGIALKGGGAGQAIDVIKRGFVAGFTFSQNYGVTIYLSDTASGILADGVGTVTVAVGRIMPVTDADVTKLLFVDIPWS